MYDTNHTGELDLNQALDAYSTLTNRTLELKSLYAYLTATNATDPTRTRISFEQFCTLVAEFSTEGCQQFGGTKMTNTNSSTTNSSIMNSSITNSSILNTSPMNSANVNSSAVNSSLINGRYSDPLYWTSALLKTRHMLRFYIVQPISSVLGEWILLTIACCHSVYFNLFFFSFIIFDHNSCFFL